VFFVEEISQNSRFLRILEFGQIAVGLKSIVSLLQNRGRQGILNAAQPDEFRPGPSVSEVSDSCFLLGEQHLEKNTLESLTVSFIHGRLANNNSGNIE
jgi:hypothetical protein